MENMLQFGRYTIAESEISSCHYSCDPSCCKGNVCCKTFDIAITFEERNRIEDLLPELYQYCPWLKDMENCFQLTPCELFIRKQSNGLCVFNWLDDNGGAWCALHTLALKKGLNPFKVKPLNCSLWPFLRDGADHLELDRETPAPCLNFTDTQGTADPELLHMLGCIAEEE